MKDGELFYSIIEREHPDAPVFLEFVDSILPDHPDPDKAIQDYLDTHPECSAPSHMLNFVYKTSQEKELPASAGWFALAALCDQILWEKEIIEREFIGKGVYPPEIGPLGLTRYFDLLPTVEEKQAFNRIVIRNGTRRLLAREFHPSDFETDDGDTDDPPTDRRLLVARSPRGARLASGR